MSIYIFNYQKFAIAGNILNLLGVLRQRAIYRWIIIRFTEKTRMRHDSDILLTSPRPQFLVHRRNSMQCFLSYRYQPNYYIMLLHGCYSGDLDVVRLAISRGANPRAHDLPGYLRSSHVCWHEDYSYIMRRRHDHAFPTNLEFHWSHSITDYIIPMLIACRNGHIDIVRYLIKLGVDFRFSNDICIVTAALNGQYRMMRFLESQGADIMANGGEIFFNCCGIWASKLRYARSVRWYDNDVIKRRKFIDLEPSRMTGCGFTDEQETHTTCADMFACAVCGEYMRIIRYIFKRIINGHIHDTSEQCAEKCADQALLISASIHLAGLHGNLAIIKYLVRHGVCIPKLHHDFAWNNALLGYGNETVVYLLQRGHRGLHYNDDDLLQDACRHNDIAVADFYMQCANYDASQFNQYTLADITRHAYKHGNIGVITLLERAGFDCGKIYVSLFDEIFH